MQKNLLWPRRWHAGLAPFLLLPFIIIAVTGVLFAHGPALGLRELRVPVGWLPGYGGEGSATVRAAARSGERLWVLGAAGVVRIEDGRASVETALAKEEVRSLQTTPQGVLAVGAKGLWKEAGGRWSRILRGPVLQASGDSQGLTAVLRGKGLHYSRDGGASWQALEPQLAPALAGLPRAEGATTVTVAQLVHDLHTGKALVSDKADWLWQDVLGMALLFLCGSGLYLWWRRQSASRQRKLPATRLPASASTAD